MELNNKIARFQRDGARTQLPMLERTKLRSEFYPMEANPSATATEQPKLNPLENKIAHWVSVSGTMLIHLDAQAM